MTSQLSNLDRLRALSNSPYAPEPPRRHFLVDLAMAFARRMGRTGLVTPHLSGGSDDDKVAYEYRTAVESVWDELSGVVDPSVFKGKEVLDAGCGWGGKTIHFAEHTGLKSIHGFDLPGVFDTATATRFATSKGLSNCHFATGFAESMPYPDKRFDVLLMEDVMEHVADPRKVVAECCRVLRPGGTVIIKFPSFKGMSSHHFDRANTLPGLHYLLPMRVWASGMNDLLVRPGSDYRFEPFDEVVSTTFRKAVTRNLNGMDFAQFNEIVRQSPLKPLVLKLTPFDVARGKQKLVKKVYAALYRLGVMREFLSANILFVAKLPD